ncbi:MAG TPA: hypothetical protein PLT91_02730 [Clostridia bacterium]|jgi:hypothetical protein|nr:MAG: hypothetical protein BWX97_01716 [Firmicutes bacterium ADurb.Bin146]HOD92889.1 hypothetical protein [Clostridia bacterium]HQM39139.1 hypothetical protein [Clostridia bacterium]
MTKIKRIMVIGLVILSLGAVAIAGVAATEYKTPAEAYSALNGVTTEEAYALRKSTGKTFGMLALEAGKSEEFKSIILQMKKDKINESVVSGEITQEEADALLAKLEANMANCDGTGMQGTGIGLGLGTRSRQNNTHRMDGNGGMNRGSGQRQNLRNGSCIGN